MKINRNFYSNLAFRLAEINLGKTNKNPSVGCIIVKDNSVISSAVTSKGGRPHAEFNALNKKENFIFRFSNFFAFGSSKISPNPMGIWSQRISKRQTDFIFRS